MLVMRKVAQAASAGYVKPAEFTKFWPLPDSVGTKENTFTWGTKDEALKMIEDIQKAHKMKIV